jgi:hypothetical protein
MRRSTAPLALFALALGACDGAHPLAAPSDALVSTADEVRVLARAAGTYWMQPGPAPIYVTIDALRKGDDRVMGGAEFSLLTGTIISEVVCLTVVENIAWIGLRHVGGTHPAVAGGISYGWIRVEDNGHGRQAAPDRSSGIAAFQSEASALWYCANTPGSPPLNPVLGGNLQVRER